MLLTCAAQAEIEALRGRAEGLENEKEMLIRQLAELREKLAKALGEADELRGTLEHMVPRCEAEQAFG
jgi:uncharacterized coiled-coil DUF342 family protein